MVICHFNRLTSNLEVFPWINPSNCACLAPNRRIILTVGRKNTIAKNPSVLKTKLIAQFGHCEELALIDVEENEIKNKKMVKSPLHEPGVLPKWLNELGTNVVISGGMGHRAINLLNQRGITVVTGDIVEEPEILIRSYFSNTLDSEQNLCSGGGPDSCGHIS